MLIYEPSEHSAADKVTVSSRGCQIAERALVTPKEDVELAMSPDPSPGRSVKQWINPKLAAVYVIANSANNLCKIGYARELRKRVLSIQGSCPIPVRLHHFVYVVGNLLAKLVEADVHHAFGEERRHGEWFEVEEPDEVGPIIAYCIRQRGFIWWDEAGRRKLGFDAAKLHKKDWQRHYFRGHAHD